MISSRFEQSFTDFFNIKQGQDQKFSDWLTQIRDTYFDTDEEDTVEFDKQVGEDGLKFLDALNTAIDAGAELPTKFYDEPDPPKMAAPKSPVKQAPVSPPSASQPRKDKRKQKGKAAVYTSPISGDSVSTQALMMELALWSPSMSLKDMKDMLKGKGINVPQSTFSAYWGATRAAIQAVQAAGYRPPENQKQLRWESN